MEKRITVKIMVVRRSFSVKAFCLFLALMAGFPLLCFPSMTAAEMGANSCSQGFAEKAAPVDAGCCCCEKGKDPGTCPCLQSDSARGTDSTSLAAGPGTGSSVPAPAIVSIYQPPTPTGRDLAPVLAAVRETTYLVNLNLLC